MYGCNTNLSSKSSAETFFPFGGLWNLCRTSQWISSRAWDNASKATSTYNIIKIFLILTWTPLWTSYILIWTSYILIWTSYILIRTSSILIWKCGEVYYSIQFYHIKTVKTFWESVIFKTYMNVAMISAHLKFVFVTYSRKKLWDKKPNRNHKWKMKIVLIFCH